MMNNETQSRDSFFPSQCTLGEGPLWSESTQSLYWVDIVKCQLHCLSNIDDLDNSNHRYWQFEKKVSAVVETEAGSLLLAFADGVASFDINTQAIQYLCKLDEDLPNNRTNDAKCDSRGRFWIGTMDDEEQQDSGRLWCVDSMGKPQKVLEGIGVSNTLAWDEQRGYFYFADSKKSLIYRFNFDMLAGRLSNQKVFVETSLGAVPDGSCIDADGYLWNAQWDGWHVVRYSPEGKVDRIIPLPVQRPTSCAFGGKDYSILFITSARVGLNQSELDEQVLAGDIFAIDLKRDLGFNCVGLPAGRFKNT